MNQYNPQWRWVFFFLFFFLTQKICHLSDVTPCLQWSTFLSFWSISMSSSLFRIVLGIVKKKLLNYLSLWRDFLSRVKIQKAFLIFSDTRFYFPFISTCLIMFLPIFPTTRFFFFSTSVLLLTWLGTSIPSTVSLFPLFIMSTRDFSMPNFIPISWLYILIHCINVFTSCTLFTSTLMPSMCIKWLILSCNFARFYLHVYILIHSWVKSLQKIVVASVTVLGWCLFGFLPLLVFVLLLLFPLFSFTWLSRWSLWIIEIFWTLLLNSKCKKLIFWNINKMLFHRDIFYVCIKNKQTCIVKCSNLAQKEYETRYDWVAEVIHWEMWKKF